LRSWTVFGASDNDRLARLAGLTYFLTLPTAGPWYYISTSLLGDGAATLSNLQTSRSTLEVVILLGAVGHVAQLIAVVLLYRLLKPFGKVAASLALVFLATSMPLAFAAIAREMDLIALLDRAVRSSSVGTEQLQAQIAFTVDAYTSLVKTASIFWGLWLFPIGMLLVRSRLVPRVLGIMVMLGGPLYLQAFVGPLFDPHYATSLVSSVIGYASGIPDIIGELGTAAWFVIFAARGARTETPAASAG